MTEDQAAAQLIEASQQVLAAMAVLGLSAMTLVAAPEALARAAAEQAIAKAQTS